MKTYLVLAFTAPDAAPSNGGDMNAWKKWMAEYSDNVVDMGSPLVTGVEGSANTGFNTIKPEQWPAQGYMMISAETMESAQEIMKSSPLGSDMTLRIFEKGEM